MKFNGVPIDELQKTKAAVEKYGTQEEAARYLGITRRAVQHRLARLEKLNIKFTPPKLPTKSRDIEELITARIEESKRVKHADSSRDLIPIPLHIDGPVGLLVFGDPHVDDAGCDFELLAKHKEIAEKHPHILAASIGDYQNNWIGRLGVLFGEQQVTSREAWKLVEWLVSNIHWLFLIAGNHDCLDMSTEILTKRGWQYFKDIRDDDEIMSLIPETGNWEWYPILSKIERDHDGSFISIKGSPVDMRVTPNHRILHKKYNSWFKRWEDLSFTTASNLPSKFSIPVSATKNNIDYDILDEWIIIAGWLLTDGNIYWNGNSPRVTFYQSKECPSLENAFLNIGLTPKINIRDREITHVCGKELKCKPKPQREYIFNVEQSKLILDIIPRKKELPDWAFLLSDRQFDILLNAIIEGDGVWDGGNPEDKKCGVVHGELHLLDSLQICAIQHGWRAHLSLAREKDWRLNLSRKTEWQAHKYASVKSEESCERVWCLTVPKGNFMVRRNGKPYFTGNCWTGSGDPLEWIASQQGSIYEPYGVRIELQHPCGSKTRLHARHDFPGTSIYSQLHGPRREALMGFRDDLIICGHKHTGACETFVTPDGNVCQIVRVAGYKVVDSYAKQLGLKKHPIFPGALVIIDPSEPNTSPNRIFTAPSVETGVIILDALRERFKKGKKNG